MAECWDTKQDECWHQGVILGGIERGDGILTVGRIELSEDEGENENGDVVIIEGGAPYGPTSHTLNPAHVLGGAPGVRPFFAHSVPCVRLTKIGSRFLARIVWPLRKTYAPRAISCCIFGYLFLGDFYFLYRLSFIYPPFFKAYSKFGPWYLRLL